MPAAPTGSRPPIIGGRRGFDNHGIGPNAAGGHGASRFDRRKIQTITAAAQRAAASRLEAASMKRGRTGSRTEVAVLVASKLLGGVPPRSGAIGARHPETGL